jgi:hypothetical protein
MNKIIVSIIILLAAAVFAGGAWMFYSGAKLNSQKPAGTAADPAPAKPAVLSGQIVWIEGAVEYKQSGGDWIRAAANTVLAPGDMIETFTDGRAIIALDDGSILRLNNNSRIAFTSLKPDQITITNEIGQVYSRVAKSERIFEVTDGENLYRSLGTAYKTTNTEKLKGVEVYASKVKMTTKNNRELVIEEGSKYYDINADKKDEEKKIAKIDVKEAIKDDFIAWNKAEDNKSDEYRGELGILTEEKINESLAEETTESEVKPAPENEESVLSLSGSAAADGINFSWKAQQLDVEQGFKLVRSQQTNPVYPGNEYVYLSNSATRQYKWKITDGQTYYFRVCQYLGGKCGKYSNNLKITAPKPALSDKTDKEDVPDNAVSAISLSAGSGENVSWKITGYSEMGFKLVWSKNSAPTYPCRDGDKYNYYSNADQRLGNIDAFDGPGLYYVRVCEYLGGKCGKYSNEISINLNE